MSNEMSCLFDGHRPNHHLRLRQIWAEALAACGYDAEEYISQSARFEELSDTDEEGSEAQNVILPFGEEISTAEYFSRAKRFDELSKIYNRRSQDQRETISEQDDTSTAEESAQSLGLNDEAYNGASASETDDAFEPSYSLPYNSSDWAGLEEDALVWRD
ncbi:MAG: hypothetical protein OHK93_006938 [Ramalina farinacea]|uniref:Uncharacterized protein n=1 Tax=Ramalina farinacea TaxID=258253 RepID=A0AA43TX62_9LECA|nr:hypothetical protein [Ramalina farinacea]